jgi:UDP-N-acetylglucosamine 2-epimerase
VIDCGYSSEEVIAAIRKATSEEFRDSLREVTNPYGSGNASARIVHQLRNVPLDDNLIRKRFVDLRKQKWLQSR